MDEVPDDPLELLDAVEEIPAPLGTGPHEVRELDSWLPWSVFECRRCGQKAWFHAEGYERFACRGSPTRPTTTAKAIRFRGQPYIVEEIINGKQADTNARADPLP